VILIVDHYDSFTYNLVQLIESLGRATEVVKSDAESAESLVAREPDAVILSPGPGRPEDAGVFTSLLAILPDVTPVLGVCLGHQALGVIWGARVVHAPRLVHGKASPVYHDGRTIYAGLPSPFPAGRYHSLCVEDQTLPAEVTVCAYTSEGEVMGLRHETLPVEGVQFHPESILTPEGPRLLANFLAKGAA
jgi:anthranilate synthase/aminodeoxychorismate synthase-like glutamine amidotransferase